MRCIYTNVARDKDGDIINDATVTVYLAGSSTLASIYNSLAGTTATNSVTTNSKGEFTFYVDRFDYDSDQKFKYSVVKTNYDTKTYDYIDIDRVVTGTYTISADTTVTTHITVPKGVVYSVDSGKTLTFSGSVSAGPYQIFSGSGTVLGLNEINAKWFGATGDGTTDDTTTLQAAFTAWSSYSTLTIPKGAYKITSPITRTGLVCANLNFEGGAYIYASASGGVALTNFTNAKINGVDIRRSVLDWATDDTGLSFNGSASSIDINYITSFNKGFKLVGGSCHYNTIRFQRMMDNKFPIYVYSSNSTTEAVNDNTFYGGRLALSSATKAATSGSYGIYMDVVNVSNLRFRDITISTMHGGIYGYGSGHMFDSLYFEGVDNYWFTGEIWN